MGDSMMEGKENQSISPSFPQVLPPEASSCLELQLLPKEAFCGSNYHDLYSNITSSLHQKWQWLPAVANLASLFSLLPSLSNACKLNLQNGFSPFGISKWFLFPQFNPEDTLGSAFYKLFSVLITDSVAGIHYFVISSVKIGFLNVNTVLCIIGY